jgi:DNA-binding MarR family transcriptional regulator
MTLVLTLVVITSIILFVKRSNRSSVASRRAGILEEAVFLDMLRTADLLSRRLVPVLKESALSPAQYNVLRILRGAREGLPCGEIAARMITRDPDITRLLDRLEKQGLIARNREARDRRTVLTRITSKGLNLLARLDQPVLQAHRKLLGHLGQGRLRKLTGLLEAARAGAT